MNHAEIQIIAEDINRFMSKMKDKYGLQMAVSVVANEKSYNIKKHLEVLGYLKKYKKKIKQQISLYDVEFAVLSSLNNPSINKVSDINTRHRPNIFYRQIFCYLAYNYNFTVSEIGRFINKDHSTVVHSRDIIKDLLQIRDPDIVKIYNSIYTNLEILLNPFINAEEDEQTVSDPNPVQDIS